MANKNQYQQRAKIFMALSDSTRLQIVELLAGCDQMSSSVIAEKLEISLSLACHHTKALAEAGLVEKCKEGQTSYNRLNRTLLIDSLEGLSKVAKVPAVGCGE
ncbi:MAG: metalloregulator ArsR/SmtB family transcription factor [Kovacikia sp.]